MTTPPDDTSPAFAAGWDDANGLAKHDDARNWPEDFAHENGNYNCKCSSCGQWFIGHKRRVTCKLCSATPSGSIAEAARVLLDAWFTEHDGEDHVRTDLLLALEDAQLPEDGVRAALRALAPADARGNGNERS